MKNLVESILISRSDEQRDVFCRKMASCLFLGGNAVLWCVGAVNFEAEWTKLVGASLSLVVNAFYYFGKGNSSKNIGHFLSVMSMGFVNGPFMMAGNITDISSMLLYTASRVLGVFSSLPIAKRFCGAKSGLKRWLGEHAFILMPIFGIASRISMMCVAAQSGDKPLFFVLLGWNVADLFLAAGPRRPSPKFQTHQTALAV